MAEPAPPASRAALIRSTLLLALWVGLVLGGLDLARILTRGDLTPASMHYLILLLNLALALAVGLPLALLLALLPRRGLVRFAGDLVQLPFSGRRAETAALVLLLLLTAAVGPITGKLEERRLAREFPGDGIEEAAGPAPPAGSANLIILVMDTVRADHLSLYGYHRPTTPALEHLAPEFLVCRDAVSSAPWTVPAHATLFTGLYPCQHGARSFLPETINMKKIRKWSNVYVLDQQANTLAEQLAGRGYLTAGLVSNPYLAPRSGLHQGFRHYQYQTNKNFLLPLRCQWLMKKFFIHHWKAVFDKPQQSAWQVNRRIERRLDVQGDRPFFLFANYMDAHLPNHAPPPFCHLFPGRLPGFGFNIPFEEGVMGRQRPVSEGELAHLHAEYDGSIRYLDHHLGLLMESLRRRGLYDESLIVVVSDHGEYFGEQDLLEHGKDVYQPAMAVPLLVRFPGGEPHGEVEARAHLVDVVPTVLSALGLEIGEPTRGSDLRSLTGERPLLGENYYARIKDLIRPYGHRFRRVRQAVYQGRWKYIHSTDGQDELYDLEADPLEAENLIGRRPEVAEPLRLWLELQRTLTPWDTPDAQPVEVDEETRERLKALGYM